MQLSSAIVVFFNSMMGLMKSKDDSFGQEDGVGSLIFRWQLRQANVPLFFSSDWHCRLTHWSIQFVSATLDKSLIYHQISRPFLTFNNIWDLTSHVNDDRQLSRGSSQFLVIYIFVIILKVVEIFTPKLYSFILDALITIGKCFGKCFTVNRLYKLILK